MKGPDGLVALEADFAVGDALVLEAEALLFAEDARDLQPHLSDPCELDIVMNGRFDSNQILVGVDEGLNLGAQLGLSSFDQEAPKASRIWIGYP